MIVDESLLSDLALCTGAMSTFYGLCFLAGSRLQLFERGELVQRKTLAQRIDCADNLFSIPYYVCLFALAAHGTITLWQEGTPESRWRGRNLSTRWFQLLYVVRMTTHLPFQWISLAAKPGLRLQMTLHHIISSIAYSGGLFTGRLHFWATFDGCCELTTIFMSVLFGVKAHFPPGSLFAVEAVSGLGLWATFVVFRIALFPAWLYLWALDVRDHPALAWDELTPLERYFYPFVTVTVLVLSCIWLVPITRGILKALGLSGGKSKAKSK